MKRTIRIFLVCATTVILSLVFPLSVLADPADPDSPPTIDAYYVNRNLLESGDWLVYIRYDVPYAAVPTDPIDENYFFQLMNGGTELGRVLAYPYNDKGYNVGIVSWYFDDATATALGLIWNTEYTIRISQNPAKFITTPLTYNFTLPASAYTALTTTVDNQTQLADRIIAQATVLENAWTLTLLSEQDAETVLDSAGETYFRNAIRGSQAMAPDAFFLQSVEIDTGTRAWASSLSDTYKARLWGADGIEGTPDDNWISLLAIGPTADLLNVPSILLIGIVVLACCVGVIYLSQKKFQTPVPGYVASLVVILCGGMLALGFAVIFFMMMALVLAGGWFLFMRKA